MPPDTPLSQHPQRPEAWYIIRTYCTPPVCCCARTGTYYEAECRKTPPWVNTPNGQKRLRQAKADVKALVEGGSVMNRSQGTAILEALTRTVTLWQGPPGTGKVRVCVWGWGGGVGVPMHACR